MRGGSEQQTVAFLEQLKEKVAECNRHYIERIELSLRNSNDTNALLAQQGDGEQGRLNRIIAALNYDDINM